MNTGDVWEHSRWLKKIWEHEDTEGEYEMPHDLGSFMRGCVELYVIYSVKHHKSQRAYAAEE